MELGHSSAEAVSAVGRALYGEDWCASMATALGVNLRTLQRIKGAAGKGEDYPAARGVVEGLRALLAPLLRDLEAAALS